MPSPAVLKPGQGLTDMSIRRRWYEESAWEVQFNGMAGGQLITPVENPLTAAIQNPNLVGSGWTWNKNFVYHGTSELSSELPTAAVDFWFTGAEVQLYGSKGWDHGSFSVSIDFGNPVTVNGHCCAATPGGLTGGILPQQLLWRATDLDPNAQHYVHITNGAAGPAGNKFSFDAFLVFIDPPNAAFSSVTQPSSTYMTPTTTGTTTHFPTGGSEYTNSKGEVKQPDVAAKPKSSSAEKIPRGSKRLGWASKLAFGLALGVAVQVLL